MSLELPFMKRDQRAAVMLCGCIAVLFTIPLTASAQQAAEPAKTAAADTGGIEEVVVTAQRREQKLQDIGISVTALGNEALANLNITTATDIAKAVPSLKMNAYSSSQAVYNIRGVAQNSYGDEQEPPVAVYQDDSYSSSINLASFPVFDLARVEVLRGPQGTLFGRNADGGAIQFISRRPTKDFDGYATATFGSFGQQIFEGALSGPLAENWQGRVALISNQDNGYIKEYSPGQQDRGANNHYALRGQLSWQPTDSINANLILRYLRANHERQAGLYSHEPACPNAQNQGEFLGAGVYCPFWGVTGTTGTGFANPKMIPSRGGTPWATEETSTSFVDRNIRAATLRLDVKLATVDLVSISDFQKANKFYTEGGDASPDLGVVFFQGSDITQYSEEIRASTTVGANQLVAGLYGMKVEGNYTGQFADPFYSYIPYITARQDTTSYAIFAQDEWKATDRVSLIAGLRYWRDQRNGAYYGDEGSTGIHIAFDQNQVTGTASGVPFDQSVTPITLTPSDAKKTFDDVTARLELDFRVNPDLLLYTSYNRGSKSGGFSFSTGTPFGDLAGAPLGTDAKFLNGIPFNPEVLDAYEAGFKATVTSHTTFDVSAFYYDYHNYQAFVQLGVNQTVVNLPAQAYGVEAEFNSHPITGLTVQLGVSALGSDVRNIVLPDTVTHVEHDLPQAPPVSGNALVRYEMPVANGLLGLQTDVQYTDKFCFTVLCAPVEQEDAYTVTNARISYGPSNKRWEIAGFVNNLTDAQYRVYAFDSSLFAGVVAGVYAKPRTYGLMGTYRFGGGY